MSYVIKVYRTVARLGSVISTELLVEFSEQDCPEDIQAVAEAYGGDFATAELAGDFIFDELCV